MGLSPAPGCLVRATGEIQRPSGEGPPTLGEDFSILRALSLPPRPLCTFIHVPIHTLTISSVHQATLVKLVCHPPHCQPFAQSVPTFMAVRHGSGSPPPDCEPCIHRLPVAHVLQPGCPVLAMITKVSEGPHMRVWVSLRSPTNQQEGEEEACQSLTLRVPPQSFKDRRQEDLGGSPNLAAPDRLRPLP